MGKKSKNSDLGRALVRRKERDRLNSRTAQNNVAARQAAATGRHTTSFEEKSKLQSVLDATDLEEFMLNAAMANEDFMAERYGRPLVPQTVVVTPLRPRSERLQRVERERRRELDRVALRIPRRPLWDCDTTPGRLIQDETEEFLVWRRKIASIEEENRLSSTIGGPMMTPFEKNLEVWRQLWRVVERSDVVVQIVDARNPLLYYCEDMFRYVTKEMGRAHLLVLNKADLLSPNMIGKWEKYFAEKDLDVIFFSAFKASVKESVDDGRVVGARDLIEKLHGYERRAPQTRENQRLVVGMCGYPNVGKSSTINVLLETMATPTSEDDNEAGVEKNEASEHSTTSLDEEEYPASTDKSETDTKHLKRVAVSSTPGKTKHFQTLVLSEDVMLCDCPGLVFPNFSSSKAELICAGVLSIDQMRGDHETPIALVASRIPAAVLQGVYGIRFPTISKSVFADVDESLQAADGHVSARMLLETHARARGFMTDHDRADQSRSTRVILKDYVSGRMNFSHGPPPRDVEEGEWGVGPAVHAKKKGRLVYRSAEVGGVDEVERKEAVMMMFEEEDGGAEVKARVSGRKKVEHREFTRVERNYYPQL